MTLEIIILVVLFGFGYFQPILVRHLIYDLSFVIIAPCAVLSRFLVAPFRQFFPLVVVFHPFAVRKILLEGLGAYQISALAVVAPCPVFLSEFVVSCLQRVPAL